MPHLLIVMFLPLAYRCRSPLIFSLGAIGWLCAFLITAHNYSFNPYPLGMGLYSSETEFLLSGAATNLSPVILSHSLPILLFWAAGRVQNYFPTPAYRQQFARFSKRMAVFSGGLSCFFLSFASPDLVVGKKYLGDIPWDFLPIVGVTIGLWVALWKLSSRWQPKDLLVLAWGVSIAGLLAIGVTLGWSWALVVVLPALFFLLLAAATLICIRTRTSL
jgi:hypothetical protein